MVLTQDACLSVTIESTGTWSALGTFDSIVTLNATAKEGSWSKMYSILIRWTKTGDKVSVPWNGLYHHKNDEMYTGQCANQNDNTYTANDSIHPPLALVVVATTVHPRKTLLLTATEIIMFHIEDIASLVYSTSCLTTPRRPWPQSCKLVSLSDDSHWTDDDVSWSSLLLPRRGSIPVYSNINYGIDFWTLSCLPFIDRLQANLTGWTPPPSSTTTGRQEL